MRSLLDRPVPGDMMTHFKTAANTEFIYQTSKSNRPAAPGEYVRKSLPCILDRNIPDHCQEQSVRPDKARSIPTVLEKLCVQAKA